MSFRSVTKDFGGHVAVDDLSFDVVAGRVTGFVGANGAGKTTSMRMALGLVAPTAGSALIYGRAYGDLDNPRKVVGAALDGPGAHPGRSARAHLRIIATASGIGFDRVDEVLSQVELTEHASRRVGGYSLGMRQRVALAGALLGDPELLVLDEPVTGLDPPGILWIRELLTRLAGEGRAMLVSSHLLGELAEVADQMVIIDRGKLIADTPLQELLRRRQTIVELRCQNHGAAAAGLEQLGAVVERCDDHLVIRGLSAREIGDTVDRTNAGPVFLLNERVASFEDIYFELAGSLGSDAAQGNIPDAGARAAS